MEEESLHILGSSFTPHSVSFALIFVNECRKNTLIKDDYDVINNNKRDYKNLFTSETTQKEIYNIFNKNGKAKHYIDILDLHKDSQNQNVVNNPILHKQTNIFNKKNVYYKTSTLNTSNSVYFNRKFSPIMREIKKPLRSRSPFKGPRRFVSITESIQHLLF